MVERSDHPIPVLSKNAYVEDIKGTHCAAETQLSRSSTPEGHFKLCLAYSVVKQIIQASFTSHASLDPTIKISLSNGPTLRYLAKHNLF